MLEAIALDDLEHLPGCCLIATWTGTCFRTKPVPGSRCCFEVEGKTRQVELGFEVGEKFFFSSDRGVDPETGEALWGALMGPYQFAKLLNFQGEVSN